MSDVDATNALAACPECGVRMVHAFAPETATTVVNIQFCPACKFELRGPPVDGVIEAEYETLVTVRAASDAGFSMSQLRRLREVDAVLANEPLVALRSRLNAAGKCTLGPYWPPRKAADVASALEQIGLVPSFSTV